MSEKSSLWDRVSKTDPSHTKKVDFGRQITAIDPYHQIENATREFGPAGNGWGWEVKLVQHLPTNEVCVLISLWHGENVGRVEQWGQASLYIDKAEQKKDTDCMKKATTDGITKCLSMLGFNADVFLGKFDDNKYVQQVTQEFARKNLLTKDQAEKISGAATVAGVDVARIMAAYHANELTEIPADQFDSIMNRLKATAGAA